MTLTIALQDEDITPLNAKASAEGLFARIRQIRADGASWHDHYIDGVPKSEQ